MRSSCHPDDAVWDTIECCGCIWRSSDLSTTIPPLGRRVSHSGRSAPADRGLAKSIPAAADDHHRSAHSHCQPLHLRSSSQTHPRVYLSAKLAARSRLLALTSRQVRIDQDDICSGGAFPSTSSARLCVRFSSSSRFGFHNASNIDNLLDKEDVSLEALLDEDDLLQECKAQNTRLVDYFQQADVLQRLLAYVTGQIEGEEKGRFKCVTSLLLIWIPMDISLHHLDTHTSPRKSYAARFGP